MSLIAEAPDFLQVFSDGTVKRFDPEIASASLATSNGYTAKDITIDSTKPITARIFLPTTPKHSSDVNNKLPIIVNFHGGGFCIGSTTWLGYHVFLGELAAKTQAIVLSIDYRLAPENRLPTAYYDALSSLEWLAKNHDSEPWLERADLFKVFLTGDSAGGNIAYNVAVQVTKTNGIEGMNIQGILLVHPYFGSAKRTALEVVHEGATEVKMNDMFWRLSIPEGDNRDYYGCNFETVEISEDELLRFPRVVVYVAELDFLKERGVMLVEFLKKKGVKGVDLIEAKEENHVFHVYNPVSEAADVLRGQMAAFINL